MDRVTTGNASLDVITGGGLPLNSLTIVAGSPGTGKTILAQQFIFANATSDRPAVYLTTLSEPRSKLIRHLQQFTFFDEDRLFGSPVPIFYEDIAEEIKKRGFEALPGLIAEIVSEHQPSFLVIDSFKALRDIGVDLPRFRETLFDLAGTMAAYACTTLLVGEYSAEDIDTLPEFAVADAIIQMVNQKYGVRDERYLRVVKMRGSDYRSGEHAFRIGEGGLSIFPRLITPPQPPAYAITVERISTGVAGLDTMLDGGLLRGAATFVAGPAGSGKTILGLHLLFEGAARSEPGLLVSFQENPTMMLRTVAGLGWDVAQLRPGGLLTHLYVSPVELNIDDIIEQATDIIEARGIRRLVVDSLLDLEASSVDKNRFRSYAYSLMQYMAVRNITTYFTYETSVGADYSRLTDLHLSYLSDNVIALRYEADDELLRNIAVVKSRGSGHVQRISNFTIGHRGVAIETGNPRGHGNRGV